MKNRKFLILSAAFLLLVNGCYLVRQGRGQLDLQFNQTPLADAAAMESEEQFRALLSAVPKIKEFAVAEIGLKQSESYTAYYATPKPAITWVVTACERFELEPYAWWFPFLGSVPYKGFFDQKDALDLERQLQAKGYDTWVFQTAAYSTLGWFKDPVTTPMLKRGYFNLAETIIHEMTHATLYVKGQGTFNEQLASFVGELGALQYFRDNKLLNDAEIMNIKQKLEKEKALSLMIKKTIPKLEALYKSEAPAASMMTEREKLFNNLAEMASALYPERSKEAWKFNNARILQYRRYESDSSLFAQIWDSSDQRWDLFWVNVKRYAKENFNYTS